MPTGNTSLREYILPPILSAVLGVLVYSGVSAVIRHVEHLAPTVGDIVSFPANPKATTSDARLRVLRAGGGHCELAVTTLRKAGGTLVVEERRPVEPRLRVHWLGGRTADDGADCGHAADLLLEPGDMAALAMAAGGYGVKVGFAENGDPVLPSRPAPHRGI